MRIVKKDDRRVGSAGNVNVQSETTNKTSQKSKNGKSKVKTKFTEESTIKDLDTGETSTMKTKQSSKQGSVNKYKTVFTLRDADNKLLFKQVDRKRGSRLRVTRRGRQAGY